MTILIKIFFGVSAICLMFYMFLLVVGALENIGFNVVEFIRKLFRK